MFTQTITLGQALDSLYSLQTVTLDSSHYDKIYQTITREEPGYFQIDCQMDQLTMTFWGTLSRNLVSTGGDGYTTPIEFKEENRIQIDVFECYNSKGEPVMVDFDPARL